MDCQSKVVTWLVEGANWTWSMPMDEDTPAEEIATRAIEDIARQVRGEEPVLGLLAARGAEPPKVGVIMMVSNEKMQSIDEHLVVLSSGVMADAGMHHAAKVLKGEEP